MDDEPATEILEAAYRALCDHGYADLTLRDIAAEAGTSKSLIHYYYDSKASLFTELLDHLYDRFTEEIPTDREHEPRERLAALLEAVLVETDATPGREFYTVVLEVNAQAPYDEAIRTQLARFDAFLFERVREILAAGVETGAFDDSVEPPVAAEFLVTAITGAHARHSAVDRSLERLYETVARYTEAHLVADGQTEAAY